MIGETVQRRLMKVQPIGISAAEPERVQTDVSVLEGRISELTGRLERSEEQKRKQMEQLIAL